MIKIGRHTEMGRALFADMDIRKGETVEITPVLVIPKDEAKLLKSTILNQYVYDWEQGRVAVALGLGSLFNHSSDANIDYRINITHNVIIYEATKNIMKGEQLFIDYGYCPIKADKQYLKTKNASKHKSKQKKTK